MLFLLEYPDISKDQKMIKGILSPGNRRYTLILPKGYNGKEELPLIISLHYGGHGLPYYGAYFLQEIVEPAFKSLGAILVAPDCPTENWTNLESVRYIKDLYQFLKAKYRIDVRKVLLIGYSMGGIGVWHMGIKIPEIFSAVIIMAAKPPDDIIKNKWYLPVFVIQGKNDELFPAFETTRVVSALEKIGVDITYRILENTTHFETFKYLPVLEDVKTWVLDKWSDLMS